MQFPRYMYNSEKQAVLVADETKVDGLFVKPPHKQAKNEKPLKYEAPKAPEPTA